ncbi:hypothetical protein PC118_g20821 [Phytophthora cactorum]|uniref:Uncharacterized protein n=1 Tax=Phytophthora cactorum TaxID=29920 RepID=A0A8T1F8N5_9STRA|nr:hypothetical protein PC118_g20821 [Phytophthora cactorum]
MEHHQLTLVIATAAAAAAEAAVTSQREPLENILTLHNVDFEEMLAHDEKAHLGVHVCGLGLATGAYRATYQIMEASYTTETPATASERAVGGRTRTKESKRFKKSAPAKSLTQQRDIIYVTSPYPSVVEAATMHTESLMAILGFMRPPAFRSLSL